VTGERRLASFDDLTLGAPEVAPGQVVASGTTASGLRVDLEGFDPDRAVDTPSEFEEWPDDAYVMPPKHGRLLVVVIDPGGRSAVAGGVSWHLETYGPTQGSMAWNIGIGLAPECRGHGVGSLAQLLLARWLLDSTPLVRIEASTDVLNIGEQKALERAGFVREGVLRSAQARVDGVHDLVAYSLLRSDL
jgi:RimJ/RimL family protein N-acetyltransferase